MPLDKAVFALKQADKHVSASEMMVTQKHDLVLGQSSYATAQRYLEEAIDQTAAAQQQGVNIKEMKCKLKGASKKYVEVLTQIESSLTPDEQKQFQEEEKTADQLVQAAAALKS
jgi:hypothetical protein